MLTEAKFELEVKLWAQCSYSKGYVMLYLPIFSSMNEPSYCTYIYTHLSDDSH